MAPAALGAANTALAAVAAGIVTATNVAGTGLVSLALAADKVIPNFLALKSGMLSTGLAMEAFSPAVGGTAATIASKLLPALSLLGKGLLIVDAVKLLADAFELGSQKLAEYVAISEKATAANVSTDFFQSISKAATDAKQPVDDLTAALKNLKDTTADQLGGTPAQNHLTDLISYGNFGGNSGVGELSNANTTEEKFRAISDLIDQAMQKGERLAALDVAKTFLGDAVAGDLAKDSDYLNKMLASADKIKAEDLVSQASIDNAVALQNRLDAAEKILSERWHPIQNVLTQGGILMNEIWVNIVENIAAAVDWAEKLISFIAKANLEELPSLNRVATYFMNATTTPESRAAAEAQYGISSNPADLALLAARQRLGSGLQNPANVAAATDQINAVQNKVFRDTSHTKPPPPPDTSAYDRATESVLKYIETTKAASLAVSDAAGEQEKFRVVAQLTAAAEKDHTTITADLAKKMDDLGNRAGAAADALAKAKMASSIDFNSKTAFLSQQDVAIASQLKGIYGNDVPAALNSTYAAGIRVNNAFKEIGSAIENNLTTGLADIVSHTKSAAQGFQDMASSIIRSIEQMIIKIAIVEPLMRSLQGAISGSGVGALLGLGSAGSTGLSLTGTGGLYHSGGIVGSEPTAMRYIHPAYFDSAPRFHSGGIAGDEVPIIARRGEGVFTPGQMAALGGAAPQVNVTLVESPHGQGTVTQSQNSNGGIDIEVAIAQIAAKSASMPGASLNRVLRDQLGANQRLTGR